MVHNTAFSQRVVRGAAMRRREFISVIAGATAWPLAIETEDERPACPAKVDRTFSHGFKHRVEIERRPADDIENPRRGRLLLQRLGKIVRPLAQSVQKSNVLDCDGCLVGEGFGQFDLLVGE